MMFEVLCQGDLGQLKSSKNKKGPWMLMSFQDCIASAALGSAGIPLLCCWRRRQGTVDEEKTRVPSSTDQG